MSAKSPYLAEGLLMWTIPESSQDRAMPQFAVLSYGAAATVTLTFWSGMCVEGSTRPTFDYTFPARLLEQALVLAPHDTKSVGTADVQFGVSPQPGRRIMRLWMDAGDEAGEWWPLSVEDIRLQAVVDEIHAQQVLTAAAEIFAEVTP